MDQVTSNVKQFNNIINQIRYGALSDELTEKMNALTVACSETNKAGEITLKIKMKPGKAGQMEISDIVSVKMPEYARETTLMFATPDGGLQREDPRQKTLDLSNLKDVSSHKVTPTDAKVVA